MDGWRTKPFELPSQDRDHARYSPAYRLGPQRCPAGGILRAALSERPLHDAWPGRPRLGRLRPHGLSGQFHPVFSAPTPASHGIASDLEFDLDFQPPGAPMPYSSRRIVRFAIAAITLPLLLAASPAFAQPTAEQQSAIRNSCRSDFMSNCSGVTPGGAEALQCLQRNVAKLSPGCQGAVSAFAPRSAPAPALAAAAPAPAAAPPIATATDTPPAAPPVAAVRAGAPTSDQQAALRQFCGADYMAKCGNVPPATREALQCLQSHSAELSENCRGALALFSPGNPSGTPSSAPPPAPARAAMPAPAPAVRPAAPPPAAVAVAAPVRPTAAQQSAIRASCQSDFMSKCSGVQPGGADALRCLQRNSAQLSPNCRSAVAAISGGAPAAVAAAPVAAAPAAAPTPQQQAAIKAACQRDFMMNCRGVTPGGPEAGACLQRNVSRLSPGCQSALAAVANGATPAAAAAESAPAARPVPAGPFPLRRALRERMLMGQ
jgi:hypothetical protein